MKIIQQKATILEPIVSNQLNFKVIANAVIFKNAGTAEVKINGGWTLAQGESVAFSATDSPYTILAQNFSIMFDGVGVNNLEVAVIETANLPEISQYVENLQIR